MLRRGIVDGMDKGLFRMVAAGNWPCCKDICTVPISVSVSSARAVSAVPCGDALPLVSEEEGEEVNTNNNNNNNNNKERKVVKGTHETFWSSDLTYNLLDRNRKEKGIDLPENPKFGEYFTDHMLMVTHSVGAGWSAPRIQPLEAVPMHPGSQVLHYGMSCFEGMKAYKGPDGRVRLFRPERNVERLLRSAQRLNLPAFRPGELLECIKSLVRTDAQWVPDSIGKSLYIRPVLYSSSSILGVSSPIESTLSVVLSPTGLYFSSATLQPVDMFVDEAHTRAWPGGAGDVKIGGNYAPTIFPQALASRKFGSHQVVYTFNPQRHLGRKSINADALTEFEECGAMNIFFVFDKGRGVRELATPGLRGTILPGVTRASIIELAGTNADSMRVSERSITVQEVDAAHRQGRLLEIFACGTASLVQPIGSLTRDSGDRWIPKNPVGPCTRDMYTQLVRIQHGLVDHPWSTVIQR
eukprot:jgi/Picsp_1/3459/NSC_06297-R1_branched chain aminotransferase cytosolic